ncbi:hypothetical protein ONZ45_g1002 [Pleurotus djamor]|nr:hypothetical protein ONZ45_g1002 [Pleurotus djamor]
MKAARYYGPGDIRIDDIPIPRLKPGQVKIKVAWNGICGTDLHAYQMQLPMTGTLTTPNPQSGETLPVTFGHEFSGTIVELGEDVDKKFAIGQNVCVEPIMTCMKDSCRSCREGSRNVCPKLGWIGITGWGGGLSEYICVDQLTVHILPPNVSLEIGAMIEPLAVAYHSVKRSGFKKGDTALVVGAGPIGQFLLKALKAVDPTARVIVSEPAQLRREYALAHGATIAFNPLKDDLEAIINKATGGEGADIVFDAAGIQASIDACIKGVRPRGTIVVVAVWEEAPKINMNVLLMKEATLTGIMCYDRVHTELIEAVSAGKMPNIEDLITSKISLEDVVGKGFEALMKEKDKQVKILVHP